MALSMAQPRHSSLPGLPRERRARCCGALPGLFAPAIEQAGLPPGRVIYVEAGDEKSVLACSEEGLRGGFGAVVAEIARLSMTTSRRLQLAAESSGAIGIAIRRWRRQTEATDFGQPTAP
jgi:protein ImuA